MCLFGCRNRQRRSCCESQWNTTENTARSNSQNCTAYGETRERRTLNNRSDSVRYDNSDCDCDCDD